MSEIVVNMSGLGAFTMSLDLIDPSGPEDVDGIEVWRATFCDEQSEDCEIIYFEMGTDYEAWDLIDEAIQSYRNLVLPE